MPDIIPVSKPADLSARNGWGIKHNLYADSTPTANNDETEQYSVGSLWRYIGDGEVLYICGKNAEGAAEWIELGSW
jgi:hypothetical protein